MSILQFLWEFWWIFVIVIPLYLIYRRLNAGLGFAKWNYDDTKIILFIGGFLLLWYLIETYIFSTHSYFSIYVIIFIPMFMAFIMLLFSKDNVFVIESTMDAELFYDIKELKNPIAQETRCRAYMIDRSAYKEIRHIGEIDYPYWNGGDSVKFTDFFDQKEGVMYHPEVSHLHNISFYIAKSFWLKMKDDLPALIRENTMLTWLAPYKATHEMSKLSKNFPLRLVNIERQYADTPFALPPQIADLYEEQLKKALEDREASEVKIPLQPEPVGETEGGDDSE